MMKRSGVPRLGPDEPSPMQSQNTQQIQQPSASNMHTLAPSAQPPQILGNTAMLSVGGGYRSRGAAPAVINYLKAGAVQYAPKQQAPPPPQPPPQHAPRIKQSGLGPLAALGRASPPGGAGGAGGAGAAGGGAGAGGAGAGPPPAHQFQRLKVEDALSYLDQVKYKFNTQPQVYNDFLDIMKEFKSQTIDTPGVITRVSNLFKGHPELIVGFNTFLPPGYKIEVQSNGQVSVSMPSPTGLGAGGVLLGVHHSPQQPQLVHLLPVPQSVSSAIVHNLSVSAAPTNTLHQISQAHQQIEAAAIHHAPGAAQPPAAGQHPPPAPPGQPVEFNHAIEYVNKIKSRFSRQPDKYKRFLEILHAYQRGHRDLKEPQAKQQTEQEVYSQVAKLFENQEDLLTEFGQFLPDAKAVTKPPETESHYPIVPPQPRSEPSPERFPASSPQLPPHPTPHPHQHVQVSKHPAAAAPAPAPTPPHHLKRSPSFSSSNQLGAPPCKKPRWSLSDVSLADASKLATPHDLGFFDRARRALKHHHVYDNFLRCLLLFTNEIISSSELLSVTAPFLSRHPELHKWLQDFLGPPSPPHTPTATLHTGVTSLCGSAERARAAERGPRLEPRPERLERLAGDRAPDAPPAMDIDLSTCKRLGTSYCALPREAASRRCSGRTALCKEVLNDTWVSFPTWSEDSTFVTSRKTQYEEYIYRCEDERFELDVVIETNASTIRVLEGVQKKLSRMSVCEAARYRLDECLGGASPTVHQRALRRIYGDKVAVDIIAGLKKNPAVAVPVVLRRLKAKEEEWREAQKGFNKQWREQNEKYYLKSLDHQGINFKQNDLKAMRSKSLFNELEAAVAARRGAGPHLALEYGVASRGEAVRVLRDAAELLIHHARRQPAIHKHDKQRIKQLLRHFLPDLLAHPRQPLSDDERDADEKEEEAGSPGAASDSDKDKIKRESSESDNASDKSGNNNKNNKNDKENKPKNNNTHQNDWSAARVKRGSREDEPTANKTDVKCEPNRAEPNDSEDDYRDHPHNEARFVCTSSWYVFLRVHCALCQRLAGARRAAAAAPPDHHSAATALRLKPNNLPASASSPSQYYSALLELVRGVLDGNVEPAAYEDAAREMLGIRAYPAYTLDKLVASAVRQLQHCVSEPWSVRAAELAARGMRGSLAYVRRARRYLRQQHTAFLVKFYGGDECKVTFELLEGANGEGRTSPNHNDTSRLSPSNPRGACLAGAWGARARGAAVFLVRNARARGGAGAAAVCGAAGAPRARRRKGLPRVLDAEECAAAGRVQGRPLQLYTAGALAAARNTHKRLAHARAHKFRAWLRGARAHQHALTF